MAMLTVQVWDATGNKRQDVELPDDAPMNRVLAVLLEKMNFPQYAPDGQPLSYKLHHRASGKQLLDDQCCWMSMRSRATCCGFSRRSRPARRGPPRRCGERRRRCGRTQRVDVTFCISRAGSDSR
jgi:hypothetical protein